MPKPLKFALVAAVLLLLGISAQGKAASWRAESQVDPPTIKTGSLSLLAGGAKDFQFTKLSGSALIPGSFTQAPLAMSNAGTVALSYQLDGATNSLASPTAADRALANAVQLRIYTGMDQTAREAGQSLTGQQLYVGPLGTDASFASARELGAGSTNSTENLCIRVSIPSQAPQSASGGKLSLNLRFTGQRR